jgi:subfamily B ATP-binding cassette protein MsbA
MLTLVTYMIVMLLISWRLLIVVALIFPVAFGMKRWVAKRIRKLSDDAQKDSMGIYGQLYQVLTAIPLFQAFSAEQIASQRYRNVAERLRSLQFRSSIYKGLVTPVQEVSSLLILLIILGMVLVLEGDGAKQIASMFVFFFVARLALPRLGSFNDIELEFEERLPSVREMFRIFDDEDKHIVPSGKSLITELRDAIEFRNLSFAYPGGPAVLHNVSFLVASGCMTALVGPSGSGKTTLTSLLMRYYDVSPGQLLIDGRDIREFSIASLRTHIAMVNQDVVLFSDTLRNNLTFGIEEAVSDTRLEQVLHNACLQELLESLPEGLDTVLGDRGLTLSGGQRQRVAIARALLRNAPILILDEATSSLDSRTERAVQKAIENVTIGCTSLVIAHRLSTIKRADRVVVLEGGQVVEKGTANELTSRRGLFHELLEAQKFD